MRTIEVRRTVDAPAARVFDLLADPTTYPRFPGVRAARLARPGAGVPHGVGAIREIDLGPVRFTEEITGYDRPVRLDYVVIGSRPRSVHRGGTIVLHEDAGRTDVAWTSTFRIPLPVVGPVVTAIAARRLARAFDDAIRIAGEIAAVDGSATDGDLRGLSD